MGSGHARFNRQFRGIKTKILNFTTSLVLVTTGFGGILPLALVQDAAAAPGLVYNATGFESLSLKPDRTTPSGGYTVSGDSLQFSIDNTKANTSSTFYQTEGLQSTIPVSRSIEADLYVPAGWANKPVRAGLWGITGSDTASDLAYPIIEYTTMGDGGFTGWRVFDTMNGGWTNLNGVTATPDAWYTLEITYNAATQNYDYYVNDTLVASKPATDGTNVYNKLQGVIFNAYNAATNNANDNYTVSWRNFRTGQAPTVQACTQTNNVVTTDLSNWSTSETRTTGHNQLLVSGLHVWTEGTTSTDKAAAYYPVNFPLNALGNQTIAQSFDYTTNAGSTPPGLQLAVDFDGNGTFDGYLVGESVYGNDWWLSGSAAQFVKDGAPHNGGGYGSQWYGTPDEWLSAFPNAHVKAIGYSLGSGVYGNYTIHRISLGCTDYTFGLAAPVLSSPANGGYETTNDFYFKWSDVSGNSTSPVTYEFQSDSTPAFTHPWDSIANGNSEQNHLTTPQIHSTGAPDGTYYWRVRALDAQGNPTAWSDTWQMTIDTHAPAVPTAALLDANGHSVANGGYIATKDFRFNLSDAASDVIRYQLRYWNNVPGSAFDGQAHAWNIGNLSGYSTSPAQLGAYLDQFTQGEGTHYFAFSACDAAGNCSAYSTPYVVTYDATAPVVSITAPHNGDIVHGTVTVSGTVTDVNPDHYYFVVKNSLGQVVAGPGTVYQATVAAWQWNTTKVADGTYTIDLEARDKAGNKGPGSAQIITVTVDNTAPMLQLLTPTGNNAKGSGNYTVSGTVTDPNFDPSHTFFSVIADNNDPQNLTTTLPVVVMSHTGDVYTVSATFDTSALKNGVYRVTLDATDLAGNAAVGASNDVTINNNANSQQFTPQTNVSNPPTGGVNHAAVLGATTGTPSSNPTDSTGNVLGDSTTASTKATADTGSDKTLVGNTADIEHAKFLGLGWWWLALLAALAVVVWLVTIFRRSERE